MGVQRGGVAASNSRYSISTPPAYTCLAARPSEQRLDLIEASDRGGAGRGARRRGTRLPLGPIDPRREVVSAPPRASREQW
jgi:hypothetical protein